MPPRHHEHVDRDSALLTSSLATPGQWMSSRSTYSRRRRCKTSSHASSALACALLHMHRAHLQHTIWTVRILSSRPVSLTT